MTPLPPARYAPGLVSILVPAKNEEAAIGATLRSLPLATLQAIGLSTEVFVLDGNSRDRTADIARAWGATVLHDREPGKASAVRAARNAIRGDYVVMVDADGSYAPDAIPAMLAPLAWGDADVVMARRRIQRGAMTGLHRAGNAALTLGASVLYGRACQDLCTGLWAFRADVLRGLPLRSQGFGLEAELFAMSCRTGLRIATTEVDYLPRLGTPKLHTTRDGWRIARRLVRTRFASLPRRAAHHPDARPVPVPDGGRP